MNAKKNKTINKKRKIPTLQPEKLDTDEAHEQTSQSALFKTSQTHEVVQVLKDVQELPCPLREICDLPEQKKAQIKISHPRLAHYYFLKPRERAKFFHQINHNYRKSIKPSEPPGSAPKRKTIKFKKRFQIKLFDKEENSKKINEKKPFTERQVRNVHFK